MAPPQPHANLGEQVRREAREGGITLTEEQLNDRIQAIVKQVMNEQSKTESKSVEVAVPPSAESVQETVKEESSRAGASVAVDLSNLTDEEIRSRAKVLTNLARQHHDKWVRVLQTIAVLGAELAGIAGMSWSWPSSTTKKPRYTCLLMTD